MDELDTARKLLLDAHKEWVESMGERGKRLDLSGENLSSANFAGADFSGADLSGEARFFMANMGDADFTGARFAGAKLGQGLIAEGHQIDEEALACLSPYQTEHINRFGRYALKRDRTPEPLDRVRVLRMPPRSEGFPAKKIKKSVTI